MDTMLTPLGGPRRTVRAMLERGAAGPVSRGGPAGTAYAARIGVGSPHARLARTRTTRAMRGRHKEGLDALVVNVFCRARVTMV